MSDFDQRFRDSLGSDASPSVDPHSTLLSMSGRLGAAKRRRQAIRGVGGGAAVALLIVGGVLFARPDQTSRVTTVSGPADGVTITSTSGVVSSTSTVAIGADRLDPTSGDDGLISESTLPVDVSGNDVGSPTSTPSTSATATTNGAPPTTAEPSDSTTGSTPTTASPATTTSSPSTTIDNGTTTSTPAPTTSAPEASETRATVCGSVTVAANGDGVTLVSATANAGYSTDIKDAGPETVEVGFEGSEQSCEVKASLVGGAISFDVDLEGEDDGEDD